MTRSDVCGAQRLLDKQAPQPYWQNAVAAEKAVSEKVATGTLAREQAVEAEKAGSEEAEAQAKVDAAAHHQAWGREVAAPSAWRRHLELILAIPAQAAIARRGATGIHRSMQLIYTCCTS